MQNSLNKDLNKLLIFTFFIFVFFPYIRILPINTDTQPYALLLSIIIFFMVKKKYMPFAFSLLLIVFIFSLAVLIFYNSFNLNNIMLIRSILNYASLFFVGIASLYILRINHGISQIFIRLVAIIYLIIAGIQILKPNLFDFLLLRSTTGVGRGLTSLTPEPTHYGLLCLFLIILSYFNKPKDKLTIFILLFQIIILAKSSLTIFLIGFFIILFLLFFSTIKQKIISLLLLSSILFIILNLILINSRFFKIFNLFIKKPSLILYDDSIFYRYYNIYFAIKAFIDNNFLPNGFGNEWQKYLSITIPNQFKNTNYLIGKEACFNELLKSTKIMSGLGNAVFELGFIGLIIPLIIFLIAKKYFKNTKKTIVFSIFMCVILLNAIPLSFPLIAFLLSFMYYKSEQEEKKLTPVEKIIPVINK